MLINVNQNVPFIDVCFGLTLHPIDGKHMAITNSDLNSPCFAWHPYGKRGLFKTE